MSELSNLKNWALVYLKNGFSVFPVKGKTPLIKWEKYQKEKPTEAEVNEWWDRWPDANIGVATGAVSGIVVVDVDGGEVPPLPPTAVVETSPGHYQYYFAHPGFPVANSSKVIAPNCDVRGDGGYVVVSPSQHFNKETGKPDHKYTWLITPKEAGFAPLPEWVLEKVKVKKPIAEIVKGSQIGARNTDITSLIGSLLARYPEKDWESVCWPITQAVNAQYNQPPLENSELRTSFESILQKELIKRQENSVASYIEPYGMQHKQAQKNPVLQVPEEDLQHWVEAKSIEELTTDTGNTEIEWIWKGYIAKGLKTEISAFWKAGKTTLLIEVIKSILSEQLFAGMETRPAKIYIVSEEPRITWINRRIKQDLKGFTVRCKPFPRKLNRPEWEQYLERLAKYCKENNFDLVVFDTISDFWPIFKEEDPVDVKDALRPTNYLTEANLGVLLFHHFSRKGAREGGAGRGSGALPADVDIIIDFYRFNHEDDNDNRRVLKGGNSRFDETPREVVIQLTDAGYITLGTKAEVLEAENLKELLNLIPYPPELITAKQIREDWPEDKKPNKATFSRWLNRAEKTGKVKRAQQGGNKPDLWSRVAEEQENEAAQAQNEPNSVASQPQPYIDVTQTGTEGSQQDETTDS